MIISIDTDVMSNVAALARSINEEISQISEIMKKITVHDDWNCKERDAINEAITQNRRSQVTLQEMSEGFARSLTAISEQFLEAERSIPNRFQHIDSMIGSVVSLGGGIQSNYNISGDAIKNITSDIKLTESMKCYEIESLTDSINICSFEQFSR